MDTDKTKSLLVALAPGLALDVLGILAILNFALNNDSVSLYLGIGIFLLGAVIVTIRLLAWQRDNAGRQ
jgi:uncharacterized membrane protein HdeD (DUF308 family)